MSNDHKISATLLDPVTRCRLPFGELYQMSPDAPRSRDRTTWRATHPITIVANLQNQNATSRCRFFLSACGTREARDERHYEMLTRLGPIWWEQPRYTNSGAWAARQCCDRTRPGSARQAGADSASRWRFRPILLQHGTFGGSPRQIGRPWWQPPRPCVRLGLRSLRRPRHEKNRQRNAPG